MVDAPPGIQAFLSVMREQPDFVLFQYLASIKMDANNEALIDEGYAREYVLILNLLEDERHIEPDTIQEVLADTKPLSRRVRNELFDQRIERFWSIVKER